MCGIFGVIAKKGSNYSNKLLRKTLKRIALLSEARGKESSGLAIRNENSGEIKVIKSAMSVSNLFKEKIIRDGIDENFGKDTSFAAIGHARLVTNGSQLNDDNNQPVSKDGIVGLHNGIIVNVDELWSKYSDLKREFDVDTEVMLALIRYYLDKDNNSNTVEAVVKSIKEAYGTVATALFFEDRNEFVLATNNGSLYILTNFNDILIFASEKFMLQSLLKDKELKRSIGDYTLKQVSSCTGYLLNYSDFSITGFDFSKPVIGERNKNLLTDKFNIKITDIAPVGGQLPSVVDIDAISKSQIAKSEKKLLEPDIYRINKIKRCTKCLLPETFPFIKFDDKGVCSYCRNWKLKTQQKSLEELKKIVEPFKSKNGEPDVIVPFSGGRDSTFTLHMVKKELGLNPLAYTYDWGMVTDLARRNIARVCGKLGVENIIVSADIAKKREHIKKKIQAWLKKPHLGMIPIFMSGDKYFFYHCNKLKKQTGIKLNIWGLNALETTHFKAGFGGLDPQFTDKMTYGLSKNHHLKLLSFVGKNIITNPSYINSSIWDTAGSYFVKYIFPRKDYYRFFDYYKWDEKKIENLILKEYKWEVAKDTPTTWRIGDGTASFYNYIYHTVAGFSEVDTFRSNQVREGMISREKGLDLIEKENYPRYESIKWYLDLIGLDYKDTINKINNIPKLYK